MSTHASPAAGARRVAAAARLALLPILLLALSLPAAAGDWQGREETRDGVVHVMNPDQPLEPPRTLTLEELWRLGGDSEDEFFGLISRIITDADGNVYLLDSQLSEVQVYSADGEYLNTLGREGEGPGEFRRASSVLFMPGGTIGVLQAAPARLVRLTMDGDPAGEFELPAREDGGFRIFMGAQSAGDQIYLLYMDQVFQQDQGSLTQHWTLTGVDADGQPVAEYYTEQRKLEFANIVIDEEKMDTVQNRWMVAADGRLYTAAAHGDYAIMSWEADGGGARVIERDYDSYKRDGEQKQEMHDLYEAFTRQAPNATLKISDVDADVFRFYPREDGSLWVLSSRGVRERPEGALGVFDVFDAAGRFVRQVTLMGEGDPRQDGLHFVGDRLYVVTDLISAAVALQGGGVGGDVEEEAEPMAVICYRIGG